MEHLNEKQITSSRDCRSILNTHGIPPTMQRLAIAEYLFSKNQHVTAEQVHQALHQGNRILSKATVYNTLGLFVQKGLIREIFVDGSQCYYDTNPDYHHHLYNVDTGELIDIHELNSCFSAQTPLFEKLHLPKGTHLESVDLVIKIRNNNNK